MNFLITGGAGFIGSHIAEKLVYQGHKVRILDNLSSGNLSNIRSFQPHVEFIKGDIRNIETCHKACQKIDFVFHEAAIASVPRSIENPRETYDVNFMGTFNILEASKNHKIKRLVLASSSAIYGDLPKLPKEEDDMPRPLSPYAHSKFSAEQLALLFYQLYGLETVTLRYFNVFGPRQDPSSPYSGVISIFMDRLKKNNSPIIFGDGLQTRDFIFVKSVVDANLLVMSAPKTVCGEIFNIGCAQPITINQLFQKCREIISASDPSAAEITPQYKLARVGDIRESYSSNKKLKTLGWNPEVTFENGLREILNQ